MHESKAPPVVVVVDVVVVYCCWWFQSERLITMSALKMTQNSAFEFYFLLKLHEDCKVKCNFLVLFKRSSNDISGIKEQRKRLITMSALKMTQKRAFEYYFLLKLHEDYRVKCNFLVHFKRSSNEISAKEQVTKLDKMAKVHLHLPQPNVTCVCQCFIKRSA